MRHRHAIFSARFDPFVGGIESFTANLAKALVKRGDAVTVVTTLLDGSPELEERPDGVSVIRLPSIAFVNDRLPLPICNRRYRELLEGMAAAGIDRVLVNTRFYPHSLSGLTFARRIGRPAVVLDHCSDYLTLGNLAKDWAIRRWEHIMAHFCLRFRPTFCGVSSKCASWLRTFGIGTSLVIPNAIDAGEFRLAASGRDFRAELGLRRDDALVAFIGRLTPEKGGDVLLEAARAFAGDRVAFAFAGEGTMRGALEAAAGGNAHFLGLLGRRDLSALLRDTDVFCLPSRSEGFCTSLLEASAWGVPSVITDVGGAREVIRDSSCGVIIGEKSCRAVVSGLKTLLDMTPAERRATGANARAVVEREYSWDAAALALDHAFALAEGGGEP